MPLVQSLHVLFACLSHLCLHCLWFHHALYVSSITFKILYTHIHSLRSSDAIYHMLRKELINFNNQMCLCIVITYHYINNHFYEACTQHRSINSSLISQDKLIEIVKFREIMYAICMSYLSH